MGELGLLWGRALGRRVLFDQRVELADLAVVALFGLRRVQHDNIAAQRKVLANLALRKQSILHSIDQSIHLFIEWFRK